MAAGPLPCLARSRRPTAVPAAPADPARVRVAGTVGHQQRASAAGGQRLRRVRVACSLRLRPVAAAAAAAPQAALTGRIRSFQAFEPKLARAVDLELDSESGLAALRLCGRPASESAWPEPPASGPARRVLCRVEFRVRTVRYCPDIECE